MKVAVSSQGSELTSLVDQRFGRAAYFIVADTEEDAFSAVENEQNLNAAQGAGIQAAQTVANQGVEAVLTGHCGPKAFRVLSTAGVKIYVGVQGTVSQALQKLKAGELSEAAYADVEGHWV